MFKQVQIPQTQNAEQHENSKIGQKLGKFMKVESLVLV